MPHVESATLQYLQSLYPRAYFVRALDAGELLGYTEKTSYNKISKGTFPLPTIREGGKRLVALHHLADYLDKKGMGFRTSERPTPPRRRGRPPKAASLGFSMGGEHGSR